MILLKLYFNIHFNGAKSQCRILLISQIDFSYLYFNKPYTMQFHDALNVLIWI